MYSSVLAVAVIVYYLDNKFASRPLKVYLCPRRYTGTNSAWCTRAPGAGKLYEKGFSQIATWHGL